MCGFFGAIGTSAKSLSPEREAKISHALSHRGPDDFQVLTGPDYKVMFWRLSIVDQIGGKQPMVSADGRTTIMFNGEIYNYKLLRRQLEDAGVVFRTHSDTEVALAAYRQWGNAAFDRFEGMFAICILDAVNGRIVLARDRLGVKPLYIRHRPHSLMVASEPKAILAGLDGSPELDQASFLNYLVFQTIPGSGTLFKGISKLVPGSVMEFDLGTQDFLGATWIQSPPPAGATLTYAEFREQARATILEQTRLTYDTDLPVSFHLSGGLDSNILVALCRHFDPGREPICVSSLIEGENDPEWGFIREAAAFHRARVEAVTITAGDFFDVLDDVLYQLDEPVGDPGVVAQFLVNRLASRYGKIVYSGQGFDEMFFGYIRNLGAYLLATHGPDALDPATDQFKRLPPDCLGFLEGWEDFLKAMGRPRFVQPELALLKKLCRINPFEPIAGIGEGLASQLRGIVLDAYAAAKQTNRSLHEFMIHVETAIQLPSLLHMEDRASMRYSIESRVPFCTASVLDVARRSRLEWTFWGGMPKGLLHDLFKDLLPPHILDRKQKVGRPVPLKTWLKGEKGVPFMEELKANAEVFRHLTGTDYLTYAVNHPNPYDRSLWAVLSLSRWIDLYGVRV